MHSYLQSGQESLEDIQYRMACRAFVEVDLVNLGGSHQVPKGTAVTMLKLGAVKLLLSTMMPKHGDIDQVQHFVTNLDLINSW